MSSKIRSYRGNLVDFEEIKRNQGDSISVGNMRINGRGDEVDEYGNVVRSRDEVARDRLSNPSVAVHSGSVISAFEDDLEDDAGPIADDPRVLENMKKSKTSSTKQETKTGPTSTDL